MSAIPDKATRRQEQAQAWRAILALPVASRATALFEKWPQRLPRWLRRRLSPALRQQWNGLRETAWEDRLRQMFSDMILQDEGLAQVGLRGELALAGMAEAWAKYEIDAHLVAASFLGIDGDRLMYIEVADPSSEDSGWSLEMPLSPGRLVSEDQEFLGWIALGLANGGNLVLREKTPMKIQLPGGTWQNQERVYGVMLGEGSWKIMAVSDLRQMYGIDHATGAPCPAPRHLLLRDLHAFVSAVRPAHLN